MFKKGFTLIELIVVIAIVTILSTIVMGNFGGARLKARDAKRISDIAQLQLALERYYDACGQYPTELNDDANNGCTSAEVTLGTFIKVPTPPVQSGSEYLYAYKPSGNPTSYHMGIELEGTDNALNEDADFDSSDEGPSSGWTNGFNGDEELIYDVRP